jgi:hypothetical protein
MRNIRQFKADEMLCNVILNTMYLGHPISVGGSDLETGKIFIYHSSLVLETELAQGLSDPGNTLEREE